jgi:hypothetical protein
MSPRPKLPGHVDLGILTTTALHDVPAASSAPTDSAEAFLNAASDWVSRWHRAHGAAKVQKQAPFALVYAERTAVAGSPQLLSPEILFNQAVALNVGGKVVIAPPTLAGVVARATKAQTMEELGVELLGMNIQAFPCVLVDPAGDQLLLCPNGINGSSMTLPLLPVAKSAFDVSSLDAALSMFHQLCSDTPKMIAAIWAPSAKQVLQREAESVIRDRLNLFLCIQAQGSEIVIRDENLASSRAVITLVRRGQKYQRECVMDVRVLRSEGLGKGIHASVATTYTAEVMTRYAMTAVNRLISDRKTAGAEHGYSCFYDCRADAKEIDGLKTLADQNDVAYRRFPVTAL